MNRRYQLIFLVILLLTACAPAVDAPTEAEPPAAETAVSPPTTAPPPAITVETPRVEPATAVPEQTEPANPPTLEAPTTEPVVEASPDEAGVTSGRTAEGAFFLGDPNAPITHIDYSDFL